MDDDVKIGTGSWKPLKGKMTIDLQAEPQVKRKSISGGKPRDALLPIPVKQVRPKALDKTRKILEVALDLFSSSHFGAITTKDIARATGFNSALLYYYFENKEDLFCQCVDMAVRDVFEQFEQLHQSVDQPSDILIGWLNTHIEQFDLIRKFVKVALDYASGDMRVEAIDFAIAQFYQTEGNLLSSCIRRGVEDKLFANVDERKVATFISTFLDGVVTRSIIFLEFEYHSSIEDLKQILEGYLDCKLPELIR